MHTIVTIIFFIYGLVFGSFFNVVGLRVPNGTLLAQTRSYCDTCQRTLTWKELIPVWSFLRQRGKCQSMQGENLASVPNHGAGDRALGGLLLTTAMVGMNKRFWACC